MIWLKLIVLVFGIELFMLLSWGIVMKLTGLTGGQDEKN